MEDEHELQWVVEAVVRREKWSMMGDLTVVLIDSFGPWG